MEITSPHGEIKSPYSDDSAAPERGPKMLPSHGPSKLKSDVSRMSGAEKVYQGIRGGVHLTGLGIMQAGAELGNYFGVVKPETLADINRQGTDTLNKLTALKQKDTGVAPGSQQEVMGVASPQDRAQASNFTPAGVGEFVGQTAPLLAVPGGATGKLAQRALTSGLAGAGIGATQFVPEGGSRMGNTLMAGALGAAIPPVLAAGRGVVNKLLARDVKGLPYSPTSTKYKAAQEFGAVMQPTNSREAALTAGRTARAEALTNRLKPTTVVDNVEVPATFNVAQTTGAFKPQVLTAALKAKNPEFKVATEFNDAEINKAALKGLREALGEGSAFPAVESLSEIGAKQFTSVLGRMEPVLETEKAMWAKIPQKYAVPHNLIDDAFATATSEPSTGQEAARRLQGIFQRLKAKGATVQALQTIDRQLNSEIKMAYRADNAEIAHVLKPVRRAVAEQLNQMSAAAESGGLAKIGDKLVYPAEIKASIAKLDEQIAKAQAAAATNPDYMTLVATAAERNKAGLDDWVVAAKAARPSKLDFRAMTEAAVANGSDRGTLMSKGTSQADQDMYEAEVLKQYNRRVGGQPPTLAQAGRTDKELEATLAKRTELQNQLANLQPADDVAALVRAAKDYSLKEKFDKFFTDTLKKFKTSGGQLRGSVEAIPAINFTETGARDLIKAHTPRVTGDLTEAQAKLVGQREAAKLSMPYIVSKLQDKAMDPVSGTMRIKDAVGFAEKYEAQLKTLGLVDAVDGVIAGQVPRYIEHRLEQLRGRDRFGNPIATAAEARKIVREMGAKVRKLMGGAEGEQKLMDWAETMATLSRDKNINTGYNPKKSNFVVAMAEKIATVVAVLYHGGWVFSSVKGAAKGAIEQGVKQNSAALNALMEEGVINQQAAIALQKVFNAPLKQVPELAEKYLRPLIAGLQAAGKIAREPDEPLPEPTPADTPTPPEPRAKGGPVTAFDKYLVGEYQPEMMMTADGKLQVVGANGPEVIQPKQDGHILPKVPTYGNRPDGTPKGKGWLGELPTTDGRVMTELTVGVNLDGKETNIPVIVPTLSSEDLGWLQSGNKPTRQIIDKAVAHARTRMEQGLSPYATPESGGLGKSTDTRGFQQYDPSNAPAKAQLEKLPVAQAIQGAAGNTEQGDKFIKTVADNVYNPMAAITTFHGSPTSGIKKFDLNFRGTGEGRLPHGSDASGFRDMIAHGIYSAENEGIAKGYQERLAGDGFTPMKNGVELTEPELYSEYFKPGRVVSGYGGRDKVLEYYPPSGDRGWAAKVVAVNESGQPLRGEHPRVHATAPTMQELKKALEPEGIEMHRPGSTYTAELLPHEDEYLHWDKPLSEQPEAVQKLLAEDSVGNMHPESSVDGQYIYSKIADKLGSQAKASEYLESLGIKGVKYADAPSRGRTGGTHNYVTFRPETESIITHENGQRVSGAVEEAYAKMRDPKSRALFEKKYPELLKRKKNAAP